VKVVWSGWSGWSGWPVKVVWSGWSGWSGEGLSDINSVNISGSEVVSVVLCIPGWGS
jgi:hypothetical protein